jgi:hypothetical protein
MATVNLGSIKFKWKGTYAGGTAYTIDDVVSYNGSSYICILASTGNLPTNATYFEQMSSAGTNGTNGTDLTTTLTTQGDLVYRDGSGLVRLGAGTAGQVLQTGGAGANPSWGSVSSDYVKIYSFEESSNTGATALTFDNIFNNTDYKMFTVFMEIINVGSTATPNFRFLDSSGSPYTSSQYYYAGHSAYKDGSSGSEGQQSAWASDNFNPAENQISSSSQSAAFEIRVFSPWSTTSPLRWYMTYGGYDNYARQANHAGFIPNLNQYRGLYVYSGSGSLTFGNGTKFSVYGHKF